MLLCGEEKIHFSFREDQNTAWGYLRANHTFSLNPWPRGRDAAVRPLSLQGLTRQVQIKAFLKDRSQRQLVFVRKAKPSCKRVKRIWPRKNGPARINTVLLQNDYLQRDFSSAARVHRSQLSAFIKISYAKFSMCSDSEFFFVGITSLMHTNFIDADVLFIDAVISKSCVV